jgi:(4S)-4-hydroxy-5-phosphonooxypentane-2,3-dione isomerase
MIVLIVNYVVKPGTEEQAKEYIRIMTENTRREPGCRMYIGHQSVTDSRQFCFYEQYEDQAALDAHRAAPYFAEYVNNGLSKIAERRAPGRFSLVE